MNTAPVLLVDDDPIGLRVQTAAVTSFGFEAVFAETVEEAQDLMLSMPFSLVISDVQMPGEGGFGFVSSMEERGLKTMPVLFLTGYEDLGVVRAGLHAGGDDFLKKGTAISVLRSRVAFWMASGFKGLPSHSRKRAILCADELRPDGFSGMAQAIEYRDCVVKDVRHVLTEELNSLPLQYGERLVERLNVIARISKLVFDRSETLGDMMRFPDYLYFLLRALRPAWSMGIAPFFAAYETWAADERFFHAGSEPLKPVCDG